MSHQEFTSPYPDSLVEAPTAGWTTPCIGVSHWKDPTGQDGGGVGFGRETTEGPVHQTAGKGEERPETGEHSSNEYGPCLQSPRPVSTPEQGHC